MTENSELSTPSKVLSKLIIVEEVVIVFLIRGLHALYPICPYLAISSTVKIFSISFQAWSPFRRSEKEEASSCYGGPIDSLVSFISGKVLLSCNGSNRD